MLPPATPIRRHSSPASGFSLLELLVAVGILSMLLVVIFSAISQVSTIWSRSMDKIEAFKDARTAFESITRRLSQATLNTYLDYDNAQAPTCYLRKSELRFLCATTGSGNVPGTPNTGNALFFQAPIGYTTDTSYAGLDSLLNTCGYFVSFTTNSEIPSHVGKSGVNTACRYRLMQMIFPANANNGANAQDVDVIYNTSNWFLEENIANYARPIADNVIALIVRPQDPGSAEDQSPNNQYLYDSTLNATTQPQPVTAHQLPPVVQVTMVAIDETSAKRVDNGDTEPEIIASALKGKFSVPAAFQDDLDALTQTLSDRHINYRVFSSAVPIRESKWTK